MFSQFIIKIIGIVYKLYLTNKTGFGDSGNAILSGGVQVYIIALTICSISLPNAISKLVSEKIAEGDSRGAHRIFKISIAVFGFLGFIVSFMLIFGAEKIAQYYLEMPASKLVIMALAPSVFFVSMISVIKGYFNGMDQMKVTAKAQSIEQILKTVYTIGLVYFIGRISQDNTEIMAGTVGLASTLATITIFIYFYKVYSKERKIIWKRIKDKNQESVQNILKGIFYVAMPVTISALLSVLTKTVDATTIVRITKTIVGEKQAVAEYGILTGKIEMLIALPFSFNIAFTTVLIPSIANLMKKKEFVILSKRIKFSLLVSILTGLICSSILFLFSDEILLLLFPNASNGGEMLKLHSISIVLVLITQIMSGILQGTGNAAKEMKALLIGLIIKIVFNILLLHKIGIMGAIFSTILSQLCIMIVMCISVKKYLKISFEVKRIALKPIVLTIIVCSFWMILKKFILIKSSYMLISIIAVGSILYIFMVFCAKVINYDEIFENIPLATKKRKKNIQRKIKKHII